MDAKFDPAVQAIVSGDIEQLKSIIRQEPSLATERSSRSHPTLLQCLVLDAKDQPNQIEMAKVLIEAGADIDAPLIAAACIDNREAVVALLDAGAAINGNGDWSPLEEALYWNFQEVVECLVSRGASIHNLRIAAGLGRIDCMQTFFDTDGTLKPETLSISSPFEKQREAQRSNDPQDVINNALIYACVSNRVEAVEFLLKKGARVNAIPLGFDFRGTALHNAALHGRRAIVDMLLESGADLSIKDHKVGQTAAGWAAHGKHQDIADYLNHRAANPR